MWLEIDGKSAHTVWELLKRYLIAVLSAVYSLSRTLAVGTLSAVQKSGHWVFSQVTSVVAYVGDLRESDWTQQQIRRLKRGLIGVRGDFSALAVVLAPILALVTEWWVVNSYGYRQIESWVIGTWTGANPQLLVFAGVAALVALSAAFVVINSGFIPSTLLVMGPVFGIGFARYGLTIEYYGTVGIPDATAFGGFVAISFGLPIGAVGFLIGRILRKGIAHFDGNRGLDSVSWKA